MTRWRLSRIGAGGPISIGAAQRAHRRRGAWALVAAMACAAPALGEQGEAASFFRKKIEPVLKANCYKCHSQAAPELRGGLRLDTRDGMRDGGDSGPAVVEGDVSESLLITAIKYADDFYQMPPDGKLPEKVIDDFVQWIEKGATDPRK